MILPNKADENQLIKEIEEIKQPEIDTSQIKPKRKFSNDHEEEEEEDEEEFDNEQLRIASIKHQQEFDPFSDIVKLK